MCGNKMPTRCRRGFYCRSYCLLNMFRAPLCPSSGAQEYYTVVAAGGIVEQAIRSAIKTSVASSWHFISTYLQYCLFCCHFSVAAYLSTSSENEEICSESDDKKCINLWFPQKHWLRERIQHSMWGPKIAIISVIKI